MVIAHGTQAINSLEHLALIWTIEYQVSLVMPLYVKQKTFLAHSMSNEDRSPYLKQEVVKVKLQKVA